MALKKFKIDRPYFDKYTRHHPAGSIIELDDAEVYGGKKKEILPEGWVDLGPADGKGSIVAAKDEPEATKPNPVAKFFKKDKE